MGFDQISAPANLQGSSAIPVPHRWVAASPLAARLLHIVPFQTPLSKCLLLGTMVEYAQPPSINESVGWGDRLDRQVVGDQSTQRPTIDP